MRLPERTKGGSARSHLGLRRTFLLIIAWLALSLPHAHAEAPSPEYSRAVEVGVSEFEQRNFLEARTHLHQAHALYPNARTLRALGMVEFELKNYAESATYLQQALSSRERPLDAEKRAQAQALLDRALGYLALLTLKIEPQTHVLVDGAAREVASGDQLVLSLGEHVLEFQAKGRVSQRRTFNIKGGEQETVRVTLAPLAAPQAPSARDGDSERRPLRRNPWLWTAVGVVVAGAAAGAAVAITRDSSRTSEYDLGTGGKRALVGGSE